MPNNHFRQLRADVVTRFPERRGEHVLLLGPPGTAKSALARGIAQAFGGIDFERLSSGLSSTSLDPAARDWCEIRSPLSHPRATGVPGLRRVRVF